MCRKGDFLGGAISLFCLPDLLTLLGLICEVQRQKGLSCRVAILAFVHLFSFFKSNVQSGGTFKHNAASFADLLDYLYRPLHRGLAQRGSLMPNICFSFMCQALTLLTLSYAIFHLIVTKPHKVDRFVIAILWEGKWRPWDKGNGCVSLSESPDFSGLHLALLWNKDRSNSF